jgi:hypothetical protein
LWRRNIYYYIFVVVPKPWFSCLLNSKLRGLRPWANYTDRATAACR